jgi:hypothetical protein
MPPLPVGEYVTKVITSGLPHGTQLPPAIRVTLLATPTPVSHGPWPENVITLTDFAPQTAVLVSGSAASSKTFVFGFELNGCMEPCSEPIVRLDPRSGALKVGPVMSADSYVETVGGRVVVFTAHNVLLWGPVTGGWSLRTVNASTLQLDPPVQLPFLGDISYFSVTPGVRGTDDVWILDGGMLLLLDTATGKTVRREGARADGRSLALSPDGRILYELGYVSGADYARGLVRELNGNSPSYCSRDSRPRLTQIAHFQWASWTEIRHSPYDQGYPSRVARKSHRSEKRYQPSCSAVTAICTGQRWKGSISKASP